MRKSLYIFITLLLFACCKKEEGTDIPDTTPQTTIMYMTGTNLSSCFDENISAAKKAITKNGLGYGRFLIFRHDSSSSGYLVEYKYSNGSCASEVLETYSDITSLTVDALSTIIADAKSHAPADSYNLIISGHATGWTPKDRYSDWNSTTVFSATSESDDINWDAMSTSPVITRYLGSKEDSFFDISELREGLEATDTHFGYILFDECFMSSIEALYELRNTCNYIIASPCEIMGYGFPYDTVLPKLFSNSGTTVDLQGACEAYVDYYSTYSFPSGCVAMAVTSELDALAEICYQINSTTTVESVDANTIQPYERLEEHLFLDFEQYMLALCNGNTLSGEFISQMLKAFPTECRLHTDRFFANIGPYASTSNNYDAYYTTINYYSGVTTSAPSNRMRTEWDATSWNQATQKE
ncbi:MAG: clostripain-related cysteine peptidase [Rikenellaceae bacterium]